ncbi:DUF1800 domain-containing protein [Chitinophaga sancti]|uniref:DUF1800 domain-containing protein n=1 Tax=Chitinophaga sancti TaxID=1004 RepID=UPI002A749DB4|nr:DUF1800 domain-containing protein [Chitinophaga sancti]WPQ63753.1 DUF1800 domain-containing protein [Chitinophaga sancti]
MVPEKLQMQHLAWRAGFGERYPVIADWTHKRRKQIVSKILIGPAKDETTPIKIIDQSDLPDYRKKKDLDADTRKMVQQMNTQGIKDLNVSWVDEMVHSTHPLREKMALFWHGHFACRTQNVLFNQQLLNVIRVNALGNFGDLLTAVSKTPAMLQFLNNQQNRKAHPNENFAREVMELFTMGRGNYTEQDVKESARAFTGWAFDDDGNFVFREKTHDEGVKNILGKEGNFNGDDVLKILLEKKATAQFITAKIYKFFVDEETPDPEKINTLADKFYNAGYDIKELMRNIFMADWFYDSKLIGNHIKSPIELLVGFRRTIPVDFDREEVMISFQQVLGQTLFYPPNVAGWPGGRNWIDSSSLMYRMQLPSMILYEKDFNIQPKEITPEMGMGSYKATQQVNDAAKKQYARMIKGIIHWDDYIGEYNDVKRENLATTIADTLLQNSKNVSRQILENYADVTSREQFIKTVTIAVMSTPEYQLC